MMSVPSLGARLRSRRWDELRLLQADVAAAAGLSNGHLSELERDRARPSEPALRRLAVVLELDPEELLAHAQRDGRLGTKLSSRGRRDVDPVGPQPVPVPSKRPRPEPTTRWLTTRAAADLLGLSMDTVRHLALRGSFAPAVRHHGKGRGRWLIAAEAVTAYEPGIDSYRTPQGPRPVPEGYLSMSAFAEATGLSYGALHRRLDARVIASVRIRHRRVIPEAELQRYTDETSASLPA